MLGRLIIFLMFFCIFSCKSGQVDISTKLSLPYQIKLPKAKNTDKPVLFLLHGYGSHELDLFGFGDRLDSGLTIVCPRAPITLQEGRYAWYNLALNGGGSRYNYNDVLLASNQIKTFIQEIKETFGLHKNEVYVGGFSQGAIMSLQLGLTEPDLIDGVIALSGHLLPEVKPTIVKGDLNIFMSHGRLDNVLSFDKAKDGEAYLEGLGVSVDEYWYQTKHTISSQNFQDMKTWISRKTK